MNHDYATFLGGIRSQRPPGAIPDNLPIVLRSATYGQVSRGRFKPSWSQRIVMVKWVSRGQAAMRMAGRRLVFGPGEMAVYLPTIPHEFWSLTNPTEMCWMTLDGPLCEQFVVLLGLRPGVYPFGPAPVQRIVEMIKSLGDQTLKGRRNSSLMAISTLYEVVSRVPQPAIASVVQEVQHIVREGMADPSLCVKGIAAQLDLHRSTLSRLYRQHTGTTIMEAITQTRLREAELLLTNANVRIKDVARKCGFTDISYFSRWMRKHTSRTPGRMRASASALGLPGPQSKDLNGDGSAAVDDATVLSDVVE